MQIRRLMLAVSLVSVAACSSSGLTDPNTIAADLRGTWTQTGLGVGSSRVFTLQVMGTTVTGTGSYAGEAGPFGNMTITGSITGARISLDFAQDDDITFHLNATLSSSRMLTGTLLNGSDSAAATFQKIQVDPPGA